MAYDYSAVDERLKKIRGDVYQAKAAPQSLPEYDYARAKVTQEANQTNQTEQDALKRRFAAMGALNSGSSIKAMQIQNDQAEARKGQALEGLNAQEMAAKRSIEQQQEQMAYQSGEAARGRAFGAEESAVGRQFQSREAQLGRQFQSGEAQLGRQFQSEETQKARASQEAMFRSDLDFKKWAANLQNDTVMKQLKVDIYNSAINASQGFDKDKMDYYLNHFIQEGREKGLY